MSYFTPQQIVHELDRYIIGQTEAKKAVAVALRNRWRRQQVPEEFREEILPNNIIMIGPTGVGKTEIARRMAKLVHAPFIKVEATNYTEVGYVGRDVESIIRDLVEISVNMVRTEQRTRIRAEVERKVEDRLVDLLVPSLREDGDLGPEARDRKERTREKLRQKLSSGDLEERKVRVEIEQGGWPLIEIFTRSGVEEMGINWPKSLGPMGSWKTGEKEMTIREAREYLRNEEANKQLDMEKIVAEAKRRAESNGIVFVDEIDKIVAKGTASTGPDVSREGVQRDLLPIVEGCSVNTRYGVVKTDHILFIAAGAFNVAKPSDLIPEFQGRFPIRVELSPLGQEDFIRILKEPDNSLIKQYSALLAAEKCRLEVTEEAIEEVARYAVLANERSENIGARRLQTVMTTLLEDVLFELPEAGVKEIVFTAEKVRTKLEGILADEDLARYIL